MNRYAQQAHRCTARLGASSTMAFAAVRGSLIKALHFAGSLLLTPAPRPRRRGPCMVAVKCAWHARSCTTAGTGASRTVWRGRRILLGAHTRPSAVANAPTLSSSAAVFSKYLDCPLLPPVRSCSIASTDTPYSVRQRSALVVGWLSVRTHDASSAVGFPTSRPLHAHLKAASPGSRLPVAAQGR